MKSKLNQKLIKLEIEIESCMDAMDHCFSISEESKLSKLLDKLQRERAKLVKKIQRNGVADEQEYKGDA